MSLASDHLIDSRLPPLGQLGDDLLRVSSARQLTTLALPFVAMGCYALFAWLRWWPMAVLSVMVLSFVTYGSSSHDLVHRSLRLPHWFNDFMLSLIELLSLRSGASYRLSHLHHHQHLLANDDIEGATAHGSLFWALASGPTTQARLWLWTWRRRENVRTQLVFEAIGIAVLIVSACVAIRWTSAPLVYVALVVVGSWLFPLVTVYIPHDGRAETSLAQTRLFRGRLIQLIAFDHLYHLEHHLYPAVPHHHWKTLANRLDPYFKIAGVTPWGLSMAKAE